MLSSMGIVRLVCLGLWAAMSSCCENRDFSGKCPQGWTPSGKDCKAPLSYAGPCSAIMHMAEFSVDVKRGLEQKCSVQWPCEDACTPDYEFPCPQRWMHMGDGICEAPLEYDRNCLKRVRMATKLFKQEFATECGVSWPCTKNCEEDFGQPCPQGWGQQPDGVCEAVPQSYFGACPPFVNLAGLSAQEKAQYGALCNVQFPCKAAQSTNECEPTDSICPIGWRRRGTTQVVCENFNYQGPCRPVIPVEQLAAIGKKKYMEMCNVEWECKNMEDSFQHRGLPRSYIVHSGPINDGGRVVNPVRISFE